jgi:hypothetical protein
VARAEGSRGGVQVQGAFYGAFVVDGYCGVGREGALKEFLREGGGVGGHCG